MSFETALLKAQRNPSNDFSRVILRVTGVGSNQVFDKKTAYNWRSYLNTYDRINGRTNVEVGMAPSEMLIDTVHFGVDPATALTRTVTATDEAMLDARGMEEIELAEARRSSRVLDASAQLAWMAMDVDEDAQVTAEAFDLFTRHRSFFGGLAIPSRV